MSEIALQANLDARGLAHHGSLIAAAGLVLCSMPSEMLG